MHAKSCLQDGVFQIHVYWVLVQICLFLHQCWLSYVSLGAYGPHLIFKFIGMNLLLISS